MFVYLTIYNTEKLKIDSRYDLRFDIYAYHNVVLQTRPYHFRKFWKICHFMNKKLSTSKN